MIYITEGNDKRQIDHIGEGINGINLDLGI